MTAFLTTAGWLVAGKRVVVADMFGLLEIRSTLIYGLYYGTESRGSIAARQ
jgi:hypothetical protein